LLSPKNWDAPVYPRVRPEAGDGQNLYADPGGTALFAVGSAGATEWSRITGGEISTNGDSYPGRGGAPLFVAPNCTALPNLTLKPSLVQQNKGFALSPNCAFNTFGGSYISPHDKALGASSNPLLAGPSSYSYFDVTSDDTALDGISTPGDVWEHITVDANPCTHNAIVAYITKSGYVNVKFVTPQGRVTGRILVDTLPNVFEVRQAVPYLSRHVQRVSLATTTDRSVSPLRCYLYTAYDSTNTFLGAVPTVQAKMKVWDVTNENPGWPLGSWPSVKAYEATNMDGSVPRLSWHSTVTASAFSPNVGWFFYDDQAKNGLNTMFHAFLDGNFAKVNMNDIGAISTKPIVGDPGGGDFIVALTGGDRGGFLVPTWAEGANVGSIIARWLKP
jgi:hypothetical protein